MLRRLTNQAALIEVIAASTSSLVCRTFSAGVDDKTRDTVDFGFKEVPREQKLSLVAEVFSNVAPSYDVMNDLMSAGMHRLWKDRLVEELRPFPGMQHLDVAGGTGDVAFRVLRAIRAAEAGGAGAGASTAAEARGTVTVCDINPDMLEEGRRKAMQSDLAGDDGLQFVVGNAESLPFEDSSKDSYSIAFGIRNVTDRLAALRDAHRLLRRGGRFLCLEFSQVRQPLLAQLYDLYSFNVIPALGELVAKDRASYQYLVESIRQFPDQETFAGLMQEAGFKAVTHEDILGGVVALHSGFKL